MQPKTPIEKSLELEAETFLLLKSRNSISNDFFHINDWAILQNDLKNFHNLLEQGLFYFFPIFFKFFA